MLKAEGRDICACVCVCVCVRRIKVKRDVNLELMLLHEGRVEEVGLLVSSIVGRVNNRVELNPP